MQALKGDPGGEDERRAAGDACSGLLALKTDMLQWPSARKILKQTLSLCDKPPHTLAFRNDRFEADFPSARPYGGGLATPKMI